MLKNKILYGMVFSCFFSCGSHALARFYILDDIDRPVHQTPHIYDERRRPTFPPLTDVYISITYTAVSEYNIIITTGGQEFSATISTSQENLTWILYNSRHQMLVVHPHQEENS